MKKVLFVCTGNTCRSPMCEAYFNMLGAQYVAHSAGINAVDGSPAALNAVKAVSDAGGDLSKFKSRRLEKQMIEESELVVALTSAHLRAVLAISLEAASKTILLNGSCDISDPFGGDYQIYRECFEEIKYAIDELLSKINHK